MCVEAFDRGGLGQIERLALRQAVDNVEYDDIAKFFDPSQMGQRSADVSATDKSDLFTRHLFLLDCRESRPNRPVRPRLLLRIPESSKRADTVA